MKSLLTMLAVVVLAAGCKDKPAAEEAAVRAAANAAAGELTCESVEVKRPYVDPTISVKAGTFLYVFQDRVRTVLDVQKDGEMLIPLTAVDDGKHPLFYGTCTPDSEDLSAVRTSCIECMALYKLEPCCGEHRSER